MILGCVRKRLAEKYGESLGEILGLGESLHEVLCEWL